MRLSLLLGGALAVALLSPPPAQAFERISEDSGGLMSQYASRYAALRNSGEKVVIDGPCYSACTMVLGYVPRERVCVTQNAVLGFHAAWQYASDGQQVTHPSATRALMSLYPARIRSWLAQRGGLSPDMKYLQGSDLTSLYPVCGQNDVAPTRARVDMAGVPVRRVNARAARAGYNSR